MDRMWRRIYRKSNRRARYRRRGEGRDCLRPVVTIRVMMVITTLAICFSGCAARVEVPPQVQPASPIGFETAEIGELEQFLSDRSDETTDKADKSDQSRILLKLAMLYSHADNPAPDLDRAVDYLERFNALEEVPLVDARYALSLLQRMKQSLADHRVDQAMADNRIRQLENRTRTLLDENREKTEIIEKLKYLDVKMEKKRGGF